MEEGEKLKKQVIHNLLTVARIHRKNVENAFADKALCGSQHRLLMDIARMLGPDRQVVLSQIEIAKKMEITPATVASALKKLEKGGYIQRVVDQEDNRYNRVEITQKGEKVIEESIQIFNEMDKQMLGGLTEEELGVLNGYLLRIKQAGK